MNCLQEIRRGRTPRALRNRERVIFYVQLVDWKSSGCSHVPAIACMLHSSQARNRNTASLITALNIQLCIAHICSLRIGLNQRASWMAVQYHRGGLPRIRYSVSYNELQAGINEEHALCFLIADHGSISIPSLCSRQYPLRSH